MNQLNGNASQVDRPPHPQWWSHPTTHYGLFFGLLTALVALMLTLGPSLKPAQADYLRQGNTSVTLFPTIDTYIIEDAAQANQSFSSDQVLHVGRDEFTQETMSLLRFDLSTIPANATITGAVFSAWLESGEAAAEAICIYRVTADWTGTVTWNSRPTIDETTCHSSLTVGSDFGQTQTWPGITTLATAWHSGSLANFGIALRSTTANAADKTFQSNEGNIQPRLVITYDLPTATPTATATGTATSVVPTPTGPHVIVTAQRDTYVDEQTPTAAHGTEATLVAGGADESERQILLYFDLATIPSNAIIEDAYLTLYLTGGTVISPTTCIQQVAASWDEATTWETRPALAGHLCHGELTDNSATNNTYQWSGLADLVQTLRDDPTANFGMALWYAPTESNSTITFAGADSALPAPQLTILYELVTPTTEPTPSATPTRVATVQPTPLPTATPGTAVDWRFEESNPFAGWQGTASLAPGPDARTQAACTWRDPATFLPMGDLVTGNRVRVPLEQTAPGGGTEIVSRRLARVGGDYWHAPIFEIGSPTSGANEANCRIDTWFTTGDDVEVQLISPEFTVDFEFLTFLVGGGGSAATSVRLEVLNAGSWELATGYFTTGPRDFAMARVNWDLEPLRGKRARLKILDTFTQRIFNGQEAANATARNTLLAERDTDCVMRYPLRTGSDYLACLADWETQLEANSEGTMAAGQPWIAVDDIRAVAYPAAPTKGAVWGVADFHSHLFTEFGLSGIYPGSMEEDLTTHEQYPTFHDGPPQKLHESGLKRAWRGGLRLAVMDVLNNESLAAAADCSVSVSLPIFPFIAEDICDIIRDSQHIQRPTRPIENDHTAVANQIQAVKAWAAGTDWATVVYTPDEARAVIRQGKLAIMLGTEVDRLAHDAVMQVARDRGYVGSVDAVGQLINLLRPGDAQAAEIATEVRSALLNRVDELYDLGVRHVIPIHLVDNLYGGMAIYNRLFDLQNRDMNGHYAQLREGWDEGVRYKIDKDFSLSMIFIREIMGVPCRGGAPVANICMQWLDWTPFIEGGETYFPPLLLPGEAPCPPPPGGFPAPLPYSASLPICGGDPAAAGIDGHANAFGLSTLGAIMIDALMERGMLIDIDHMSNLAKDSTLTMAERTSYNYPIMASHTGFQPLNFGAQQTVPYSDATARNYGTSDERKLANERALTASQVQRMMALGGNIGTGVNTNANRHRYGPIPNNCDGTSVSYMQSYFYALEQLQGRGIGLGTDIELVGLAGLPHPRFGTEACHAAIIDESQFELPIFNDDGRDDYRRLLIDGQARFQDNGVLYESRLLAPYNARFGSSNGAADGTEREMWLGAAFYNAGVNIETFEAHCGFCPSFGKVKEFARGLRDALASPTAPKPGGRAGHAWEAVRFVESGGLAQCRTLLTGRNLIGDLDDDQKAKKVWCLWLIMEDGDNVPLSRSVIGARDFDINIDGMAHYGLLPDFIQDMANVVRQHEAHASTLAPVLQSAEYLIQMWELSEERARAIRGESTPTPPAADRFETTDDLAHITTPTTGWEHSCNGAIAGLTGAGACAQVFENNVREGQITDRWQIELTNLSLHSATDRDYFQIPLPDITDPAQGGRDDIRPQFPPFQDDNGDGTVDDRTGPAIPMPECATINRQALPLIPSEDPYPVTVEVATSLIIHAVPVDGTVVGGDHLATRPIYLYANSGERHEVTGLGADCPQSALDASNGRFSIGRLDQLRETLGNYNLDVVYETTIVRSGEPTPPDWLGRLPCIPASGSHSIPRGPGGVFAEIDLPGLPLGGGFPGCFAVPDLGESILGLHHPLGVGRECLVSDCGESFSFNWPAGAGSFNMTFVSNGGLNFTLVDAAGNQIGAAVDVPPLAHAATVTGSQAEQPTQQQLAVENLAEGFYYLTVSGTEGDYLALFTPIAENKDVSLYLPLIAR